MQHFSDELFVFSQSGARPSSERGGESRGRDWIAGRERELQRERDRETRERDERRDSSSKRGDSAGRVDHPGVAATTAGGIQAIADPSKSWAVVENVRLNELLRCSDVKIRALEDEIEMEKRRRKSEEERGVREDGRLRSRIAELEGKLVALAREYGTSTLESMSEAGSEQQGPLISMSRRPGSGTFASDSGEQANGAPTPASQATERWSGAPTPVSTAASQISGAAWDSGQVPSLSSHGRREGAEMQGQVPFSEAREMIERERTAWQRERERFEIQIAALQRGKDELERKLQTLDQKVEEERSKWTESEAVLRNRAADAESIARALEREQAEHALTRQRAGEAAIGLGKEFEKLRIAASDKDKKIAELEATCKDYSSLQHRFSVALQDLTRAKVEEEMAIKEREAALKSLEQERQTSERAIQSERDTMRNNSLFGDAAMRSLEAERDSVVRALQQAKGQIERLETKEALLERKLASAAKDAQRPQIFSTGGMNAVDESRSGAEVRLREREQALEERERAVRDAERRMYDELLEKHKESDNKQNRIRDSFQHKIETLQGTLSREVHAGEGARTAVVRLEKELRGARDETEKERGKRVQLQTELNQMKIEIDETRLELDQARAGCASAQRECALLNVQLEKTRAMLEREREESYTRTRLLGARPSSSGSSVVKSHSLTVLRKEAIESIEAGRDDGIESGTTARSRSPSGDLSTPTVSLALSAGQDLLEIGLSEKRRIERKLKDIGGPAIARIKGSATTQTSQNVILALCLILGFASDTSLSWQEIRVLFPDRVWDDMAVYPQGGWSKSGGARYETGLKAAWGLVKEMSLSDSFVDDQALGLIHEWLLLVLDLSQTHLV